MIKYKNISKFLIEDLKFARKRTKYNFGMKHWRLLIKRFPSLYIGDGFRLKISRIVPRLLAKDSEHRTALLEQDCPIPYKLVTPVVEDTPNKIILKK